MDPKQSTDPDSSDPQFRFFKNKASPNDADKSQSTHAQVDLETSKLSLDASRSKSGDSSMSKDVEAKGSFEERSEYSISISEHIIMNDSIEISINNDVSNPDLSIPSLHLKSISKSDTDYADQSGENELISHDSISHNEEIEKGSLESDSLDRDKSKNDFPRISDESSIHTQFDVSVTPISSKHVTGSSNPSKEQLSKDNSNESDDNDDEKVESKESTLSDDVIKLDIRGTASEKFSFFSNPIDDYIALNHNIVNLASMKSSSHIFLKSVTSSFDPFLEQTQKRFLGPKLSTVKIEEYEQDCAIEEKILNESRNVFPSQNQDENVYKDQDKQEGDMSLSTVTTEYKPLCEEFHQTNLQDAFIERDKFKVHNEELIQENEYLSGELHKLRELLEEARSAGGETKGQLSDFVKHENMINEDATDNLLLPSESSEKLQRSNSKCSNFTQTDSDKQAEVRVSGNEADRFRDIKKDLNDNQIVIFETFESRLSTIFEREIEERYADAIENERKSHKVEVSRLKDILLSIKSGNPQIAEMRREMEAKHKEEVDELRVYYEKKCFEIEKNFSEEIFSEQSKKMSVDSSLESLNNCQDAVLTCSPSKGIVQYRKIPRSHSEEFQKDSHYDTIVKNLEIEQISKIKDIVDKYETQIDELKRDYKAQITELKADLQTYQNTVVPENSFGYCDTDLELEKDKDIESTVEKVNDSEDVSKDAEEVLLSDPNMDSFGGPLNFIALKNKEIEQLKTQHAQDLATLREENARQIISKENEWRLKRYEAFDKNRHLEDVVKERDGMKHKMTELRKSLKYLVNYFNLCEDELNNLVVGDLLEKVNANDTFDNTIILRTPTKLLDASLNTSIEDVDPNCSALSRICKMHFTPDVTDIMTYIDPECSFSSLEHTHDISTSFKDHLDTCLRQLRIEAQQLVAMTAPRIPQRLSILPDNEKLIEVCGEEKPTIPPEDDTRDLKVLQDVHKQCEMAKKELEVSLVHSRNQELELREQLQIAVDKIAELENKEVISEGYGLGTHPRTPMSLPPHPRLGITSPPPLLGCDGSPPDSARSHTMDGLVDKKTPSNHETVRRLTNELESTTKEKEDLQMQLEAANKQLRSTRQFLEEQAAEREQERDEFQKELEKFKDENSKLTSKTQHYTRICKEVEQLEIQMREMSTFTTTLEDQRNNVESELKANVEKMTMLRDIIGNLESQLETKTLNENKLLEELNSYKQLTEEQEERVNELLKELEKMKDELSEKIAGEILAAGERQASSIAIELETEKKLVEQMRVQLRTLVETLAEHTSVLENVHEVVCSQSCSSPSEDVSIKDLKKRNDYDDSDTSHFVMPMSPNKLLLRLPLLEVSKLGDGLHRHLKAEDAALKRISDLEMQLIQLKDVAQELRTERDILQERMSEQSLRISSLQSRLDQTRHTAEAMTHQTTEDIRLQLDEALSEAQLLREALDSRDKQVTRLKALVESTKKRLGDQEQELSACTGTNKDVIQRLKRELREQQARNRELQEVLETSRVHHNQLPEFFETVVADKNADIESLRKQLAEKEQHIDNILSLKIDGEESMKHLSNSENEGDNQAKLSARTLSDILSISEFDEPDVLRRADMDVQNCLSGELNVSLSGAKNLNMTKVPVHTDIVPITASTLHDLGATLPNEDLHSPIHENQEYKRSKNETTAFGMSLKSDKHSTADNISDNCSMFPNKHAIDDKDVSVEPKRIDFSVANSSDCRIIQYSIDINSVRKSLEETGLEFNYDENDFINVINDLKNHIINLQNEIDSKQVALIKAEEQLAEFPLVQNEMKELKNLLQNSLKTMQDDKLYYNNQLEKFNDSERGLKRRLEETMSDVNEKSSELQILKEDIVRREKVIMDLAKEKHDLERSLSELKTKYSLIEGKGLDVQLKSKIEEVNRLEHSISEKNQQIDSLNANLDKLESIERELHDKNDLVDRLSLELENKCKELEVLSQLNSNLKSDDNKVKDLRDINLSLQNEIERLKDSLQKLESDLLNVSQREMALIEERNQQTLDNNKDIEEILKLDEFNNLLCELTSPRSPKSVENVQRRDNIDVGSIRQHISKLKSELSSKEKDLNIKVFDLERAKLEIVDLKTHNEELDMHITEKDKLLKQIAFEREQLELNLKSVLEKLNEESNLEELHDKLIRKSQECVTLENEVESLRNAIDRYQRDAVLASDRENRIHELSMENGRLKQHLFSLENSLNEQDNLIIQLNDVKDSLITDLQALEAKSESEKDTSARLQLLLDSEKKSLSNLQSQDSSVIQLLKSRLEEALDSKEELKIMFEKEKKNSEQLSKKVDRIKKQSERGQSDPETSLEDSAINDELKNVSSQLDDQVEIAELLKSEVMLQKTKYDRVKSRMIDLQNILDREKLWFQKEIDASKEQNQTLKEEIDELMKLKEDLHNEVVSLREKLHYQINENLELEKKLLSMQNSRASPGKYGSQKVLNGLEQQKEELLTEVAYLKHSLDSEKEKNAQLMYTNERNMGKAAVENDSVTLHHLKEMQMLLKRHIAENVQQSETVKELTHERRELQLRVKELENQGKFGGLKHSASLINLPTDVDKQVTFLYGRYMRLHSYRKQLVFQKHYLAKTVKSYEDIEKKNLNVELPIKLRGKEKFRAVVFTIRAIHRLKYLAKRWHTGNVLAANMHLNVPNVFPTELRSSKSYTHIPVSPSSRDKTRPRYSLNQSNTTYHTPLSKPANKSWSMGSAVNSSLTDRLADRRYQFRSNNLYKDGVGSLSETRWHTINESPRVTRDSHQEVKEFPDEVFLLRSPNSGTEGSSAFSGYMSGLDHQRRRMLNSRDQL